MPADVSKTLLYSDFDSAEAIGGELFERVIGAIGRRTAEVVAATPDFDAKVAASLDLWQRVVQQAFGLPASDARFVATAFTASATAVLILWVRERRNRAALTQQFVRTTRAMAESLVGEGPSESARQG